MMILVNQKSKQYPKDNILSYKVIIIQKETIRKVSDGYMYDAYKFNSLNAYNSWLLEQKKNIEIQNLQQENKQLEDRCGKWNIKWFIIRSYANIIRRNRINKK